MKKIIMTGGGTAGHVTANIALMPALKEAGYEIKYIGSIDGIERKLITAKGIEYFPISSGKLRRYFDVKNFSDPFRVIKGYNEARAVLKKEKPNVIFSKGGYVSVPVVLAAHSLHIPAVIHESDMTPGLANKIAIRGAVMCCCNFPETVKMLPDGKAVLTGTPIRQALFNGSKEKGLEFAGIDKNSEKPVLMIIGGSLGAQAVNELVRASLDEILPKFNVIHLCGKGKLDESLKDKEGYTQFEYVDKELPDVFATADIVISRAGANAIMELLALKKPTILIPLPKAASRGDQILNAQSFEKQGFSKLLLQEEATKESLLSALDEVYENKDSYVKAMTESHQVDSIKTIVDIIENCAKF